MAYQPEIEKLERKYQDDPARHFAQLAEQYRRAGRLDEALDILAQHLAERPNYVSGLIVQGRCYLDRHDDASARHTFERVLSLDAEHIIALKALADIADRAGDAPQAISWVGRLLEVDPMNEEAQELVERLKTEGARPVVVEEAAAAEAEAPAAAETPEEADADARRTTHDASTDVDATEPMAAIEVEAVPAEAQTVEPEAAPPTPVVTDERAGEGLVVERAEDAFRGDESETVEALAPDTSELAMEPFDQDLAWGTGERRSQEISAEDMEEAERSHDAEFEEVPYDEIVGLEPTAAGGDESPTAEIVAPVEGIEVEDEGAAPEVMEPRGSLTGLPLILPPDDEQTAEPAADEPEPAPVPAPAAADAFDARRTTHDARDDDALSPAEQEEPDLVVTETMGEIYARQGLTTEARDVYRRLVRDNPGEPRFAERLRELEAQAKPGAKPPQRSAAAAGGQTARAMLAEILTARPGDDEPGSAPESTPPAAPAPATASPGPAAPIDTAFSSADDEPEEPPPSGTPTQPATDEVSLGSAFGDQPSEKQQSGGDGFSFDEFFSGAPAARPSGTKERPSHAERDDESDAQFRDWLKGLKG